MCCSTVLLYCSCATNSVEVEGRWNSGKCVKWRRKVQMKCVARG